MPPRGQSLTDGLLNREIGNSTYRGHGYGASQLRLQGIILSNINFNARSTLLTLPPAVETAGVPIVAKFNKNPCFGNGKLLAVGGEEGVVTIADTQSLEALERGRMDGSWRPRAHWPCHRNSIFDLSWAKNDSVLFTASGHQQVGLWDTDTARALAVAEGHEASIKSIATLHLCEDVFATGARDGRMMLWDARCPGFGGQVPAGGRRTPAGTDLDNAPILSPVWVQDNAHARPAAPGSSRASAKAAKQPAVTVTSVAFLPYSYLLASAGAHDTVVKLWDLRMHGLPLCDLELPKVEVGSGRSGSGRASGHKAKVANANSKNLPHEVAEFTCPSRASAVGVTHLAVSDAGDRLLVSCLDSQHHLYSLSRLTSGPLATWRAPQPAGKGTFYMRSAFSPCGNYILSGSRDAGAHIWLAADPKRSPIELPHEHEVTGVAWCGSDWSQVATCCDSGEVRLWTLDRQPAHAARRIEDAAVPAMASHVAELDVAACSSNEADARGIQHQAYHGTNGAGPSAVPAGLRSPRNTVRPLMRRTVQLRLNLQRKPAAAPPATETAAAIQPAPATAADVAAAAPPRVVPLLAVMEAAASPAAVHAGLAHELFLRTAAGTCVPEGKLAPACAAAVRATAVGTPVSTMAPAAPASAGPSCARRAAMLPPVPIFSPAMNSWQQHPPRATLESARDTTPVPSAPAPRLTRAPEPAGASSSAFGGLEAAMKNLAQVRTQSPARVLPPCDINGAESGGNFVHNAAGPNEQDTHNPVFGKPPLPPHTEQPAELPAAHSFPPSSGTGSLLAARGPAVSPHTTPVSISRIRSRLGPFSPSRSTFSSGSGPFSNAPHSGSHSNGGSVGTPTAGQRHTPGQAPQGVVDQILRKSPRHSSRTGHAGGDSLMSPRLRRTSLEGRGGVSVAAEVAVPRRLFTADGDGDEQPLGGASGPATGAVQGPHAAVNSGVDLLAAVDSLLQQPNLGVPAGEALAASRTPPRLSMSPVVYDFQDGQDVGPALRYRAAHPDDMGPYIDFSLDAAAGHEGAQLQRFMPDAAGLLIRWDSFTDIGVAAGATPADRDRAGEQVGDWLVRRAIGNEGGFLVASAAVGNVGTDDGSDSDWEFDPYGDKENTPPPEPLPDQSHQTSSGGSGAVFASPSRHSQPEDDQPLPLPLLEPLSSTPTRAAAATAVAPFVTAAATASVGAPSGLRWARLTTPFAAAYPIAAAAGSLPADGVTVARPESAPSLHSEPTVSAGIAPSSTGGAAAGSPHAAGAGGTVAVGGHHGEAPSVRAGRGAADLPAALVTMSRSSDGVGEGPSAQQAGRRQSIDGTNESSEDSGQRHHAPSVDDNLTPTKRPRRAYSSSDDQGGAGDRSPSPTRRVRSSGIMAGPAPTPGAKQRFGGAYATAVPSPALRSSRPGGISRLAPAPGAGYLLSAAAVAAAGIGSESPAIKVGTVPRTGGRHTAASEEFFRRREQEERSHAMMSPFGFGMFSGAAETPGGGGNHATPRTTSYGVLGTVAETEMELESGGVEDGRRGGGSSVRRALGLGLLKDDDFGPMEKSVRSLSRMFETSSQGGGDDGRIPIVPCTFPEEEGDGAKGEGQSHRLAERLPSEERTMGSPAVMPCCKDDGVLRTEGGDEGGFIEPNGQRGNDGRERQGSFRFSTVLCQDPQPACEFFRGSAQSAFALQASEMRIDESSRSAPIDGAAEGGVGLQTAWSGHDVSFPRGTSPVGPSVQSGLNLFSTGWRLPTPAGRAGNMGSQPVLAQVSPSPLPGLFGGMLGGQDQVNAVAVGAEAQQAQHVQPLHRPRQMTLQEIWGPTQRHPTPPMTRPMAASPMALSRGALGPTGLTSPRFLR